MNPQFTEQLVALAQKSSGAFSVCAERLDTGARLAYRAEEPFPTASVVKLPALFELFRQVRDGKISLEEKIALKDEYRVIGSGILKDLSNGLVLSLRDLAMLMMGISDNIAANIVMDRVGIENINSTMRELGLSATRVTGKILIDQTRKTETETGKGELSPATASDLVFLLKIVEQREYLGKENSERLLHILHRVQTDSVIARGLPREQLQSWDREPQIKIAHKTGTLGSKGIRANAGIVYLPNFSYAIALLGKGFPRGQTGSESEANLVLGAISKLVYEEFTAK